MSEIKHPIAVWFADSHLDPFIWKSRRDIMFDSFAAFNWLVKEAARLGVPVFIAGDIIDVRKPPSLVVQLLRMVMNTCRKANIKIYFIQGQHDRSEPAWLSAVGRPWFEHVNDNVVEVSGHRVFASDWKTRAALLDTFDNYAQQITGCDTLMLHQVWSDLMGGVGSSELNAADIPPGPRTVFTGDYHRREERELKNSAGENFQLISPGSTHLRSATEPTDKWFYILDDAGVWHPRQIEETRPTAVYTLRSEGAYQHMRETMATTIKHLREQAKQKRSKHIRKPLILVRYHPDYYTQAYELSELAEGLDAHYLMRASRSGLALGTATTDSEQALLETELSPEVVSRSMAEKIEHRVRENVADDPLAMEILLRTLTYLDSPAEAREELISLQAEATQGHNDPSEKEPNT